jgi:hypothetical protein
VLANTIAAEIGDIHPFASPRKLAGYPGPCPRDDAHMVAHRIEATDLGEVRPSARRGDDPYRLCGACHHQQERKGQKCMLKLLRIA